MNEKEESIELPNYPPNKSIITNENIPYSINSTSKEIENIFKKIRKKNDSKNQSIIVKLEMEESKDMLARNEKKENKPTFNLDMIIIIVNFIGFILFYFSFFPIKEFTYPITFFIYPMDFLSFIFLFLSSIFISLTLFLIINNKIEEFHFSYIFIYHISMFFHHHFKNIGRSKFDQSFTNYYILISLIIICFMHFIYILLCAQALLL